MPTKIEWTDEPWNPVTGCSVLSPGCTNCYAMRLAGGRLQHHPSRIGLTDTSAAGPVWNGRVRFNKDWLDKPLRWRRPRLIFVCPHGDLFHERVPDAWLDRVFAVFRVAAARNLGHRFQVLTKRPARMRKYIEAAYSTRREQVEQAARDLGFAESTQHLPCPLPNLWIGVSVEDQQRADERIPELLRTKAAIYFVSAEPLLGPLDLTDYMCRPHSGYGSTHIDADGVERCDLSSDRIVALDWCIVGGESGPRARPMHPEWATSLCRQCAATRTAFFFKQWGAWKPYSSSEWAGLRADPERKHVAWDREGNLCRYPEGREEAFAVYAERVDKKQAGRMLEGRRWDEMPEAA